jgi:hypothetical protein
MKTERIDTNLEQYLAKHQDGEEFILRIWSLNPLTFYVRPYNKDGETLNFTVNGGLTECVSERIVD